MDEPESKSGVRISNQTCKFLRGRPELVFSTGNLLPVRRGLHEHIILTYLMFYLKKQLFNVSTYVLPMRD